MKKKTCLSCHSPLPAPSKGRPATFCSDACKRSREHQIRRAGRLVEKLEMRAADSRIMAASNIRALRSMAARQELPAIEAEIERAEERLRSLLAGAECS